MAASDEHDATLAAEEEARIRAAVLPRLTTDRTILAELKRIAPHRYYGYIIEHDDLVTHFEATIKDDGTIEWKDWS